MYVFPGGRGRKVVSSVTPDNKGRRDCSRSGSESRSKMSNIDLFCEGEFELFVETLASIQALISTHNRGRLCQASQKLESLPEKYEN